MGWKKSVCNGLALILITASVMTSVWGCARTKPDPETSGEVISADSPWFETNFTVYEADLGVGNIVRDQAYQRFVGRTDDGLVSGCQYNGEKIVLKLFLFADDGKPVAEMNVCEAFKKAYSDAVLSLSDLYLFHSIYISDGKLKFKYEDYKDHTLKIFDVDIKNESFTLEATYEFPKGLSGEYGNTVIYAKCGQYDLFVSMYEDFCILTVDPDGSLFCFEPDDQLRKILSGYVSEFIPVSDTKMMFYDFSNGRQFVYDAGTGTLTEAAEEYDWFKPYFSIRSEMDYSYNTGIDGKLYGITPGSIAIPDFEKRCFEDVVLLEDIDINRAVFVDQTKSISVLGADADSADLMLMDVHPGEDGKTGFEICKATRAKTNPHAGKALITTDGYYIESVYDAVWLFNKTDNDYFIKVVPNRYEDEEAKIGDQDQPYFYKRGEIGNRMMTDLMSGDCPDVVFYVREYGQLNNGNCMTDLLPYYEKSGLQDKVFDNIVRACEIDGGLYAMPLAYYMDGIVVDRSIYDREGRGMTMDDFKDFTDRYCNGINLIAGSRLDFMEDCLAREYDLLLKDGVIDFDQDFFRDLAAYTSDHVDDIDPEDRHDALYREKKLIAADDYMSGPLGWFKSLEEASISIDNADMIGYPSGDGRGPSVEVACYVSVTKNAHAPEGAWRFIELLLSHDIQCDLCAMLGTYQNRFPVEKDAFESVGKDSIELIKKQDPLESGKLFKDPDKDYLKTLSDIAGEVSSVIRSDPQINIIIHEEIQPYLAGDKPLDDVIKIMNDRAWKVLKERD